MLNSAEVAQWILSLVTAPDRAASTVGDLMEDAAVRGVWWFWLGVFRTTLSLLWQEIAENPARMAGLAVRGVILDVTFVGASFVGMVLVFGFVGGLVGMGMSAEGVVAPSSNFIPSWWLRWLGGLMSFFLVVGCDFQVGRWIARRAPGKEIAACLAMIVVEGIVINLIGTAITFLYYGETIRIVEFLLGVSVCQLPVLVYHIPCFAGAVWVRRRHQTLP
jgi:hypothetical protein